MTILPHSLSLFESVGLLLRTDSEALDPADDTWDMPADTALRYLRAVGSFIDTNPGESVRYFPRPTSLSLLGGEPLANPEALQGLLAVAAEQRMVAEVWTSGSWVDSLQHAADVIAFQQGRMHILRLHTNAVLAARVGMQRIEWLLDAARAAGIMVHINCLTGAGAPLPRALLGLPVVNTNFTFFRIAPLYPDPASDASLDASSAAERAGASVSAPPRRRCAEKFGFFIRPDGDVYPCLQSAGLTALRVGSLANQGVADIVTAAAHNQTLLRLRREGPRFLHQALAAHPEAGRLAPGNIDACDFHRHLLADARLADAAARSQRQGSAS